MRTKVKNTSNKIRIIIVVTREEIELEPGEEIEIDGDLELPENQN